MEEKTRNFLNISTRRELAECLGIQRSELLYICRYRQPEKLYRTFEIRKSNGEKRTIFSPNRQLRLIQRRLNAILYVIYSPKKIAHGYVRSRNVVTNAAVHAGNRHVLNLDLSDFFPSIHFGRVQGLFKGEPFCFNDTVSKTLAQLVCFRGILPQGAPTSPIVSNLICRSLDNDLVKLCGKYKVVCTRYCDDITISTKAPYLPAGIVNVFPSVSLGGELAAIIEKNNFKVNPNKIRLQSFGTRKTVTGIVVNVKPNILREKYRKFRATLFYTCQNGLEAGATRNGFLKNGEADIEKFSRHIRGKINYYKMVMGLYSTKYRYLAEKGNELFGNCFPLPDQFESLVQKNLFVIETDESQGTAFLLKGIGLITCLHNVWEIKKPVDEKKLNQILARGTRVYLPPDQKHIYDVSLKQYNWTNDLLVLDIEPVSPQRGLELAERDCSFEQPNDYFFSAGYPNYAKGRSIDWLRDIRVRSTKTLCGQRLLVTDKTFITGASGGPVFDRDNKVVGYIDRGNTSADGNEEESAFCQLSLRSLQENSEDHKKT